MESIELERTFTKTCKDKIQKVWRCSDVTQLLRTTLLLCLTKDKKTQKGLMMSFRWAYFRSKSKFKGNTLDDALLHQLNEIHQFK